jgi:hypothetical protein
MRLFSKLTMLLAISLLMQSCNTEDDDKGSGSLVDGNTGKREIRLSGVSNFGRMRTGASMNTEIRIKNPSSSSLSVSVSGITTDNTEDFYILSNPCSPSVRAGQNCKITITFSPDTRGFKSITFRVNSNSYSLTGEAIPTGEFYVTPSLWDVGSIQAGDGITETFAIYNEGANSIPAPVLNDTRFFLVTDSCDDNIQPNSSCEYTIRYNETESGDKDFELDFSSLGVGDFPVSVLAEVSPGSPSGLIRFDNVPNYISVNDTGPTTVDITLVPDSFGNPVSDGTIVTSTLTNGSHSGSSSFNTVNGQGQLSFISTSQSGDLTLEVFAGEAVGVITIPARPGPADGTIGFLNFNNNIRADGTSTITIQTEEITDSNGNNIANGDNVYAWIASGDANSGSFSPEVTQSFNGRAAFNYTSGTSAQSITVGVGADPVFDGNGDILSFGAEGFASIALFPNIPSGDFDITCESDNVFFLPETVNDYLDCSIGPITDASDNPVGAGANVDVSLLNAQAAPFGSNVNNFTIQTQADSVARLTLFGVGARGFATIDASNNSERVTHQVFMVGETQSNYDSGRGGVGVYFKKSPSIFDPTSPGSLSPTSNWDDYTGDLTPMNNLNFSGVGFNTYSRDATVVMDEMPFLTWDCFKGSEFGAYIHPCGSLLEVDNQLFAGSSKPFFMSAQGGESVFKLESIGSELATSSAHGFSDIIFPLTAYDKESGEVVISGGARPYENFIEKYELTPISNTSSYGFPRTIKSRFSDMSYFSQSSIASGFMYSVADSGDKSFVFGGLSSSSLNPIDGLYVLNFDSEAPSGGDKFSLDAVTTEDNGGGVPVPRYDNGIHYSKEENSLYVYGGWARDQATNNWYALRDVWVLDLDTDPLEWSRICSLCNIPENPSPHVAQYVESISGEFLERMDYVGLYNMIGAPKLYYDRDSANSFVKYQNDGSLYEADLSTGDMNVVSSSLYDFIRNADNFIINDLTGKKFAYSQGSLDAMDSQLVMLDAPRGQKQFYRIGFQLGDYARDYFVEADITVSVLGVAKTYSSSSFINDQEDFGASVYIYNNNSSEYELLGANSVNFEPDTNNDYMSFNIQEQGYVSLDNEINLLITPSSNTGYQFGEAPGSPSPGESKIFLNYVEIMGRY